MCSFIRFSIRHSSEVNGYNSGGCWFWFWWFYRRYVFTAHVTTAASIKSVPELSRVTVITRLSPWWSLELIIVRWKSLELLRSGMCNLTAIRCYLVQRIIWWFLLLLMVYIFMQFWTQWHKSLWSGLILFYFFAKFAFLFFLFFIYLFFFFFFGGGSFILNGITTDFDLPLVASKSNNVEITFWVIAFFSGRFYKCISVIIIFWDWISLIILSRVLSYLRAELLLIILNSMIPIRVPQCILMNTVSLFTKAKIKPYSGANFFFAFKF